MAFKNEELLVYSGGRRAGKSWFEKEWMQKIPKQTGKDPDLIIYDEIGTGEFDMTTVAMSTEAIERLEELAATLTTAFTADPIQVALLSPATLTVSVPGKGFRKHPHVGGENFTFVRAYVGAKGAGSRLIFVLKPVDAAPYDGLELTENEAQELLDRFRASMSTALGVGADYAAELTAIRRLDSHAREVVAMQDKFNDYETFGSW